MSATIADIVSDAQGIIGEVAGVGVQQFTEDTLFDHVVRGFNMMFKKYPWDQYCQWFRVELDGVTGVINTDAFEQVRDFEDFLKVARDADDRPIPKLQGSTNPYAITSTGASVQRWTSLPITHANYAKRRLQFYPLAATGFVNVRAKVYPLVPPAIGFDWTDVLYLDRDLLAYAGAFMTLVGDALNASAAETVKQFMDDKYNDITGALASQPIAVGSRGRVPDEWFART